MDATDPHSREYFAAAEGMADLYGRQLEPEPASLADCYGRPVRVGDSLIWARVGWPAGLTMTSRVLAIDGERYVVTEDGIQHYVTPDEVMPL